MSAGADYYQLLELPVSASENEIKKAYRKMALKWHPDKNPDNTAAATKMFNKISEAYEVLSDRTKRDRYDRFGTDVFTETGRDRAHRQYNTTSFTSSNYHFRDPFDIFHEFFGGRDPFSELFPREFPYSAHNFTNIEIGTNGPSLGRSASWSSRSRQSGHHHARPFSATHRLLTSASLVGFSPFFTDSFFGGSGDSTSMMFGGGSRSSTRSVSTSTRTVNGRTVTTKTVVENGISTSTVTVEENGILVSKTIDGQQQLVPQNKMERSQASKK